MSLPGRALLTILTAMALASPPLAFGSAQIVLTLNPSLAPSAARLLQNTSGSFTATAVAGPNSTNVTALVRSWTSSNTAIATIDSTGHVTAKSPGSTTVTATLVGAVKGSTVLTVTVPTNPVFTNQPGDTSVSAIIDAGSGVKVQLADNLADPLPGLTVTMSIGTNAGQGGTGVLGGTLTRTSDSTGTVTFSNLTIDWLGTGYTLVATAATPIGPLASTSNPFNELRVGDPCLGPIPACSSGCPDTDGDGLNDAWETAGGIDLNGDGKITDAQHDLLLPGADPNKPDVYVKYDYMVATTTNPAGSPPHSHQPPAAAIQQVVDAYALHGINLHIDPQHDAIPEVFVTTRDPNPTVACAANGISGGGYTFVTMQTLRQQYFGNRKWAYHYVVFAHSAVVPDTASDCTTVVNPCTLACPTDPECGGHPDPTSSGNADVFGSNVILALGTLSDLTTIPVGSLGVETYASTFMHELGHNFGLKHGSLAAPAPQTCLAFKPNYLSVMDYNYYANAIGVAVAPGSTTPRNCSTDSDCPSGAHCTNDLGGFGGGNVCYRVDYSREKLLDLNEASLNELLGVGADSANTDIVTYCAFGVACTLHGPAFGPIDWNNNGHATDTNVQADIDNDNNMATTALQTAVDWGNLNFKFQCSTAFATDSAAGAPSVTAEPGLKELRERHVLCLPANVSISIRPGCSQARKPIAPGEFGKVTVALLGSDDLDVNQVEPSSLNFHGARPLRTSIRDVNGDGKPDLVAEFETRGLHLHPDATKGTLTGWLKNSRAFSASDEVIVVPSMAMVDQGCRQSALAITPAPGLRHVFEPSASRALPTPKLNVRYDKARLWGKPQAPVTIVEFADFQCPYCRKAESTLKEVLAKYEGKVSLAYRDFPLQEIHANAEGASEAARCAGEQGKFWEYRDLLFSSATLDRSTLAGYAGTLGLNARDFNACLSANKYRAAVERDEIEGKQAGVDGTPAFFINGVPLTGAQPASAFEAIIDRQLAAMKEKK